MAFRSKLGGARDNRSVCVGSSDTNCDIDETTSDIAARCTRETKTKKKENFPRGQKIFSSWNKYQQSEANFLFKLIHAEHSNAHFQRDEFPRSGRINI